MNETVRLVLTIVQVLICLVMIVTILFQSGKNDGLGSALGGAAETFFGKNSGRSLDAKLSKLTAISAGGFILVTYILTIF